MSCQGWAVEDEQRTTNSQRWTARDDRANGRVEAKQYELSQVHELGSNQEICHASQE